MDNQRPNAERRKAAFNDQTKREEARGNAQDNAQNAAQDNAQNAKTKSFGKKRKNRFVKPYSLVRVRGGIDRPMLVIIIALLCFGLIMVFSASFAFALKSAQTGHDSFYYIKRQGIFAIIGVAAMIGISFFDYRVFRRFTPAAFIVTVILLIAVPIYGRARGVASRWVEIGPISIQPTEIMKLVLVLFLANYMARHQDKITNYNDFWKSSIWGDFIPLGIIGVVDLLILLENHFSGLIIVSLIGMVVIFVGGARKFWFGAMAGAGGIGVLIVIMFTDYARKRIDVFLHPENYSALDETWQTLNGLNAIGSGGVLGVGLGNSFMKYNYVSAPQNDFIFSIVCEELGLVGAAAVILLFALFVWRGFVIAMRAPDTFSSLVVIGITSKVAIQTILNIGVVTSMIPNTGISLPFFSYGGSALLLLLAEMGVILAISRYSYKEDL